jgi:hypothetical protein
MKPFEFRLYHNNGKFLYYSCEELDGEYIVIDALTYALGDPHVQIVDGKIKSATMELKINKFVQSNIGTKCAYENVCIIVDEEYKGLTKTYSYEQIKF